MNPVASRHGSWHTRLTLALVAGAAAAVAPCAGQVTRPVAVHEPAPAARSAPSLEERAAYQRRIEELRYREMATTGGTTALSDFDKAVPNAATVEKVRDQLRLAHALERVWGHRISQTDLAAELDRVLTTTRDPATLRALFAALDNDPDAIACCLLEPLLVRRLAHRFYWWDPMIHGDLKARAEAELAAADADGTPGGFSGETTETEWRRGDDSDGGRVTFEDGVQIRYLTREQWQRLLAQLDARWARPTGGGGAVPASGQGARSLPRQTLSRLMEEKEYFWASRVIAAGDDFVRLAAYTWWKTTFSEWWAAERRGFPATVEAGDQPPHLEVPQAWTAGVRRNAQSVTGSSALAGDAWYPLLHPDTDAPSPRDQHTAVWVGSQMIVWGGTNGSQYFKSGGVYDPATNSWSATPTTGDCPSARIGHGAVAVGGKMYVWGGWNGTDRYNTGATFNPAGPSWSALPVDADTPTPRYGHVMVGVEGEFYVWGGMTSIGVTSSGAGYLVSAHDWVPTPTDGDTPAARYQASEVADPDSWFAFLVWGGSGAGYFGDGGSYEAGYIDAWDSVPADASSPSPRFGHTAVLCSGSCCPYRDMIIWGGYAPGDTPSYSSTGGLYPTLSAGGSWTATPTGAGVPAGRSHHTAVIDNARNRMIVWGGTTASGTTKTGGQLNLCTSTWEPTGTTDPDTPSKRTAHTALWNGAAMFVWGGSNGATFYDDGALYSYCWSAPSGDSTVTVVDEDACAASGIRISWTDDGVRWGGYEIYTSVDILRDGSPVATGLEPSSGSYLDTTATAGVTYSYQVQFRNTCGLTMATAGQDAVDQTSVAPTVTAETTVTDADGCTASSGLDVSWPQDPGGGWGDNGSGNRRYRVWRWDNFTASWSALGSQIAYGTTSYHDGGASSGLQYNYKVRYINGCGDSAETAPSGLTIDGYGTQPGGTGTAVAADAAFCSHSGNRVTWAADPGSWGDNDEGERFYRVQRSTDGETFNPIGSNIAYPATTWVDAGANPDQTYYYRVRYKNGCDLYGDSGSDTATDAAGGVAPTITVNSDANDGDRCVDAGILVTWGQDPDTWGDGDEGTRTYDVLRDGSPLSAATGLTYGTTSFTDTTGANGTSYLYQVRYTNGCAIAAATPGDTGNDRPTAPQLPAGNSTATDVDDFDLTGVHVTWDSDPDGTWGDGSGMASHTYEVLRDGTPLQSDIAYGTTELTDTTGEPGVEYLYTVRYWNCGGLYAETAGATAADNGVAAGIFIDGFEQGDMSGWSSASQ